METIGLSAGDLTWVFGPDAPDSVALNVSRSAEVLLSVASGLTGGVAGWSGEGLEYSLLPSKPTSLIGYAENQQVTFWIELLPPGYFDNSQWEVNASISVRCNHQLDDGMHIIEERETRHPDGVSAAAALAELAGWLQTRNSEVEPAQWQERDLQSQ